MRNTTLSFDELQLSSELIRSLIRKDEKCQPFVEEFYSKDTLMDAAERKQFDAEKRAILLKALQRQNEGLTLSKATKDNLDLLSKAGTSTIVTGHQLNLFTGPLYSIYKIAQTIALANEVSTHEHPVVPVFWMASEDHDFAEINHFHLFNDKISWNIDSEEKVVGRLPLNGLEEVIEAVKGKFADEAVQERVGGVLAHYTSSKSLAEATRKLINHLFGEFGLLIIDGDAADLKAIFAPIVEKELTERIILRSVSETNVKLASCGYHEQVHVRPYNLFYIDSEGKRHRIQEEGDGLSISGKSYTITEAVDLLKRAPEAFSPNALMRPIYQELILPNLCYIGGGGEIAYWLQLKTSFKNFGVDYPVLKVRDSYIELSDKDEGTLDAFNLSLLGLKNDLDAVKNQWVEENMGEEISLKAERDWMDRLKEALAAKLEALDPGLEKSLEGEAVKWHKSLDHLEAKMLKAEKRKNENVLGKLDRLYEKVYPNGGFQERYDNFLPRYISNPNYIKSLVDIEVSNKVYVRILKK